MRNCCNGYTQAQRCPFLCEGIVIVPRQERHDLAVVRALLGLHRGDRVPLCSKYKCILIHEIDILNYSVNIYKCANCLKKEK